MTDQCQFCAPLQAEIARLKHHLSTLQRRSDWIESRCVTLLNIIEEIRYTNMRTEFSSPVQQQMLPPPPPPSSSTYQFQR